MGILYLLAPPFPSPFPPLHFLVPPHLLLRQSLGSTQGCPRGLAPSRAYLLLYIVYGGGERVRRLVWAVGTSPRGGEGDATL